MMRMRARMKNTPHFFLGKSGVIIITIQFVADIIESLGDEAYWRNDRSGVGANHYELRTSINPVISMEKDYDFGISQSMVPFILYGRCLYDSTGNLRDEDKGL